MNWRGINLKNKELRICMVGAGFVGMKHAAVYSALYNTKMQIACDSNIIKAMITKIIIVLGHHFVLMEQRILKC